MGRFVTGLYSTLVDQIVDIVDNPDVMAQYISSVRLGMGRGDHVCLRDIMFALARVFLPSQPVYYHLLQQLAHNLLPFT